jgi:hypothetical protein
MEALAERQKLDKLRLLSGGNIAFCTSGCTITPGARNVALADADVDAFLRWHAARTKWEAKQAIFSCPASSRGGKGRMYGARIGELFELGYGTAIDPECALGLANKAIADSLPLSPSVVLMPESRFNLVGPESSAQTPHADTTAGKRPYQFGYLPQLAIISPFGSELLSDTGQISDTEAFGQGFDKICDCFVLAIYSPRACIATSKPIFCIHIPDGESVCLTAGFQRLYRHGFLPLESRKPFPDAIRITSLTFFADINGAAEVLWEDRMCVCDACGARFCFPDNLSVHKSSVHSPKIECSDCGKRMQKSSLAEHRKHACKMK